MFTCHDTNGRRSDSGERIAQLMAAAERLHSLEEMSKQLSDVELKVKEQASQMSHFVGSDAALAEQVARMGVQLVSLSGRLEQQGQELGQILTRLSKMQEDVGLVTSSSSGKLVELEGRLADLEFHLPVMIDAKAKIPRLVEAEQQLARVATRVSEQSDSQLDLCARMELTEALITDFQKRLGSELPGEGRNQKKFDPLLPCMEDLEASLRSGGSLEAAAVHLAPPGRSVSLGSHSFSDFDGGLAARLDALEAKYWDQGEDAETLRQDLAKLQSQVSKLTPRAAENLAKAFSAVDATSGEKALKSFERIPEVQDLRLSGESQSDARPTQSEADMEVAMKAFHESPEEVELDQTQVIEANDPAHFIHEIRSRMKHVHRESIHLEDKSRKTEEFIIHSTAGSMLDDKVSLQKIAKAASEVQRATSRDSKATSSNAKSPPAKEASIPSDAQDINSTVRSPGGSLSVSFGSPGKARHFQPESMHPTPDTPEFRSQERLSNTRPRPFGNVAAAIEAEGDALTDANIMSEYTFGGLK